MEVYIKYFTVLSTIAGFGVLIGINQEKLNENTEQIAKLIEQTSTLDVIENKLINFDKRLSMIEYGKEKLVKVGGISYEAIVQR